MRKRQPRYNEGHTSFTKTFVVNPINGDHPTDEIYEVSFLNGGVIGHVEKKADARGRFAYSRDHGETWKQTNCVYHGTCIQEMLQDALLAL